MVRDGVGSMWTIPHDPEKMIKLLPTFGPMRRLGSSLDVVPGWLDEMVGTNYTLYLDLSYNAIGILCNGDVYCALSRSRSIS